MKNHNLKALLFMLTLTFLLFGCSGQDEEHCYGGSGSMAPRLFYSIEELLAQFAVANFSEFHYQREINEGCVIFFRELKDFYVPYVAWEDFGLYELEDFELIRIVIWTRQRGSGHDPIVFRYQRGNEYGWHNETIAFGWWFDRDSAVRERGTYFFLPSRSSVSIASSRWERYGYEFETFVPWELVENMGVWQNAFNNARPLTSWEIQGNAASISVQGMENISILDDRGSEIVAESNRYTLLSPAFPGSYVLYQINDDGTRNRIGYRWLFDKELHRYQYVLEPGVYTFHAEGVIGEHELLIRHFAYRDVVANISYAETLAEQSANRFTLTVDGLAREHVLSLE